MGNNNSSSLFGNNDKDKDNSISNIFSFEGKSIFQKKENNNKNDENKNKGGLFENNSIGNNFLITNSNNMINQINNTKPEGDIKESIDNNKTKNEVIDNNKSNENNKEEENIQNNDNLTQSENTEKDYIISEHQIINNINNKDNDNQESEISEEKEKEERIERERLEKERKRKEKIEKMEKELLVSEKREKERKMRIKKLKEQEEKEIYENELKEKDRKDKLIKQKLEKDLKEKENLSNNINIFNINNNKIELSKEKEEESEEEEAKNNIIINKKIKTFSNKKKHKINDVDIDSEISEEDQEQILYKSNFISNYTNLVKSINNIKKISKRKPISRLMYNNLLKKMIHIIQKHNNEINYEINNSKKINDNMMNKYINNLEYNLQRMKNSYIYSLVKKHYCSNYNEKKKILIQENIPQKRNNVKKSFMELMSIIENNYKFNEEDKKYYYEIILKLLIKYDNISEEDFDKAKKLFKENKLDMIKNIDNFNINGDENEINDDNDENNIWIEQRKKNNYNVIRLFLIAFSSISIGLYLYNSIN